jgi:prevent-host-death family protein
METINVAEAKSRFSELISRASAGERFVIRRRERTVAVLVSPGEYERLERAAQAAFQLALALGQDEAVLGRVERGETHPAMAAFGLWRDEDDLEKLAEQIVAERKTSATRSGISL